MGEKENTDSLPDQNKSDRYILSIRLSADGFSFYVFDADDDSLVKIAEKKLNPELTYGGNLKQAFREHNFLNWEYQKVFIVQVTSRFTLIPLEIFDESQMESLYAFNFTPKDTEKLNHNILVNNSCVVLFGVDGNVKEYLAEKFPRLVVFSHVSVLAEYFSQQSRPVHNKQMFASVQNDNLDLYCFDRGFISLVNSYTCSSVTDYSYYILYVWKQLGMDQQNDELNIIGQDFSGDNELTAMLARFVKKINLMPGPQLNTTNTNTAMIPFDVRTLLYTKARI